MQQYILAHDLGTSGNKASLFSLDGTLFASQTYEYDTFYPANNFVEQSADDWWRALCVTSKGLLASQNLSPACIVGVCFSGQMMGCLPVDSCGMPLRNSIIWADTRGTEQASFMEKQLGMEAVYKITGHRISASYSAAKLLWIREHEPEIFDRTYKILQAKDYMIFKLTRCFVTDYSDASGTQLFDIRKKNWSKTILKALSIPENILPEPVASSTQVGTVTPEAAVECGILAGTPVIVGGGDGSCACVGAGVVAEGKAYNVLGSSSWTSYASHTPYFDSQMRTFNWVHLDPDLYTPCGTMQAAGYSYRWWKNGFCPEETEPNQVPPGSNGLLFLPYLLGERAPLWDTEVRGSFIGLSVTSDRAAMTRAILEGVGFNLKHILNILSEKQPINDILLIGGGAKSTLWPQILADIWQRKLLLPAHPEEATSIGAAVCGGFGIGAFKDFGVVEQFNRITREVVPNQNHMEAYDQLYPIFLDAYERLKPISSQLAQYRKEAES